MRLAKQKAALEFVCESCCMSGKPMELSKTAKSKSKTIDLDAPIPKAKSKSTFIELDEPPKGPQSTTDAPTNEEAKKWYNVT